MWVLDLAAFLTFFFSIMVAIAPLMLTLSMRLVLEL
jgi:hypothetical protein